MAILGAMPGVAVTVQVGGRPLKEYTGKHSAPRSEEDDSKYSLQYVEIPSPQANDHSATTQNYEIHVGAHSITEHHYAGTGHAWHIAIDGKDVDQVLTHPKEISEQYTEGKTCLSAGQWNGSGSFRPYQFAKLHVLDSGSVMSAGRQRERQARASEVGTIKIFLFHIKKGRDIIVSKANMADVQAIDAVSEEAVKGKSVSHSTQ
jgi:hypothetical protein